MTSTLRVAIVHAADAGGGAERSVLGLHRGLRRRGHQSTMFVGERRTDQLGVEAIPYVRGVPGSRRLARALEHRFGWQDIYNPSFRALGQRIRNHFDVVHFNSLWGSAGYADIAALPLLTREVPGVITLRENWLLTGHCACFDQCQGWRSGCGSCPDLERVPRIPRDGTRFNWLRKRRAIQGADLHAVAISDWLLRAVNESPIFAGKSMSRIYNGIDLGVFRPLDAEQRARRRVELGIAADEIGVLLAGQTVNGLNSFQAPRDARRILSGVPATARIRPLVIGPNANSFSVDLKGAVPLPFQHSPSDMATCYGIADLTLVTSEAEAFGRIAAESQGCGTPVVAFDTGGIPEVVIDGAGGRVVARGDIEGAIAAICELAEDPLLRSRMALIGIEHVRNLFDDDKVVDEYLNLYHQVLGRAAAA
ncbi:MAG: glycosyltransferase [Xanthomonadales bacterium]|nr:glycosyltransferase [Xanthomonadales bacterium]